MDRKLYFNNLYDYYANLFTEKQRAYYEDYYFRDLSLSEIADNHQVSRNAVYGQIKIVEERLEFYECALQLYQKHREIQKILEEEKVDITIQKRIEEWM